MYCNHLPYIFFVNSMNSLIEQKVHWTNVKKIKLTLSNGIFL